MRLNYKYKKKLKTRYDFYKEYVKPKLKSFARYKFFEILDIFIGLFREDLLNYGSTFIPTIGYLELVEGGKPKLQLDENGEVITKHLAINWGETRKARQEYNDDSMIIYYTTNPLFILFTPLKNNLEQRKSFNTKFVVSKGLMKEIRAKIENNELAPKKLIRKYYDNKLDHSQSSNAESNEQ